MGTPISELNLWPFSHKVEAVKYLLTAKLPSARRAMQTYLIVDVLGNIAVFVPLGAALAAANFPAGSVKQRNRRTGARWWLPIIATGLLFRLGVELVQLAIPSRATDIDDVILNTLGTMIGALVAWGLLGQTGDE